ncbi:hypothetical protein [Mycolicibacterium sp.]|uniref:hypothetical protein n=1 Tax=Mycolicibacterium sp. TaxID=2320850 RepID=UPI00355F6DB1
MPAGVEVEVEDGFATIFFADRSKLGPGLAALLAIGGPETVESLTLPRRRYRVPEGNARAAGLLDDPPAPAEPVATDHEGTADGDPDQEPLPTGDFAPAEAAPKQWPDGEPDDDWKRLELDAYARSLGIDPAPLSNKPAVLAAINEARRDRG